MVARVLAQRRQLDNLPRIYTAALLKDIGKIVLHDFVAGAIGKIQSLVRNENLSFDEAERICLGVDHAALGAMIARQWQFNPDMVSMIENHHLNNPDGRPEASTAVIYWADMVSMMAESDFGVDRLAYRIYEDSFQELTLHKDEVRMLMQMYNGFLKGAERLFEIHQA
jgi:HD-like signal output (HDOD) protein